MKISMAFFSAAAVLLAQTQANAAALTVVNVNAPAINCVFDTTCKVVVHDTVGSLLYAPGAGPRLQSRSFKAQANAPAAGKTAYIYRVDLTEQGGITDCIGGVVINFGPTAKLNYAPNTPAQVYVITTGGLGSVGIKSAQQDGDVITFNFDKFLCPGQTSYFFGLAADKAPVSSTATLFGIGALPFIQTTADVPQH